LNGAPESKAAERVGVRSILGRRAVLSILAVVLMVMVGVGMVFPIVPLYARSFGVSLAAVGFFISVFGITRLVFDLLGGVLIDPLGDRVVTVAGLVVMALSSIAIALVDSFGWAAVMWALQGGGSAVVFAGLYSYLLKAVPKEQMARALGVFYGTFNVGIIAGGPMGGLLAHRFGLRSPFIVFAGALAVAVLIYLLFVDDSSPRAPSGGEEGTRPGALRLLPRLLRNRGFLAACASNLAYLWMVGSVFDTLVPLMARERLHMTTSGIGALFAVVTATELAVLYPAGSWADRLGRRAVLLPSLAALAVTTAVVGLSPGPVALAVILGVLGLASGIAGVPPAAILSDVSPEQNAGTTVGVFRFFGDLGFVFGPILAGTAAQGLGFELAFALTAIPTVLALGVAAWAPETLASKAPARGSRGAEPATHTRQ
jgi:ACDE family multidrug resistance protein